MRCLKCGCVSEHGLCPDCRSEDNLDRIFQEIRYYKPDTCSNPYLREYANGLTERYAERDLIPDLLSLFDEQVTEYYTCLYYRMRRDERFETAALAFLQTHVLPELKTQRVLYDLIECYLPNEFIKPKKWCHMVAGRDDLSCELYLIAAKYFAMIGEYDLSDEVVNRASAKLETGNQEILLFCSQEAMRNKLREQRETTQKYRTKKPYWPQTEERRRAVAMFYDEKGIAYPRITTRALKVPENEFAPIRESCVDSLNDYCAFWCSAAFSLAPVKCIYQIAAIKVRNSAVVDTFTALIRPWDGGDSARRNAAKEIGVPLEEIEAAKDVDLVMPDFFTFVGKDILVSTEALSNQAKLLSRAARHAGMREIPNEFFDLLDYAADISEEFDLANNTREYLIKRFNVSEGKTALEKAFVNQTIYETLTGFRRQHEQ